MPTSIFGDTISNCDESILGWVSEYASSSSVVRLSDWESKLIFRSPLESMLNFADESRLEFRFKSVFSLDGGEPCDVCEDEGLFSDWKDERSVVFVSLESVEEFVK